MPRFFGEGGGHDQPPREQSKSDRRDIIKTRFASATLASLEHPERNEDRVVAREKLAIVVDGVGGKAGGEKAADTAINAINGFLQNATDQINRESAKEVMRDAFEYACQEVARLEEGDAVATAVRIFRDEDGKLFAVIGSLGDCRAYLLRGRKLEGLTVDDNPYLHNLAYQNHQKPLYLQNELSNKPTAEYLKERHFVLHSLGEPAENSQRLRQRIHVSIVELQPGDVMGITSDGIHDSVRNEKPGIFSRSKAPSIQAALELAKKDPNAAVTWLITGAQNISDSNQPQAKLDDMSAAILTVEN